MNKIDIEDIDMVEAFFHFTKRDNFESINKKGLEPKIGDASEYMNDKARICYSKGGKGMLGIVNSFIWHLKNGRTCDIPEGYREYFDIENFSSTERPVEKDVYEAYFKRMKDEIYLLVDAKEGIDFDSEEMYGLGVCYDIKGKENQGIEQERLKLVTSPNGDTAFDIISQVYNRLLTKNPEHIEVIKEQLSDLNAMIEYIEKTHNKNESFIDRIKVNINPHISKNQENMDKKDKDIDFEYER